MIDFKCHSFHVNSYILKMPQINIHREEGRQLLDEEKEAERPSAPWLVSPPWIILLSAYLRRHLRFLLFIFAASMVLGALYLFTKTASPAATQQAQPPHASAPVATPSSIEAASDLDKFPSIAFPDSELTAASDEAPTTSTSISNLQTVTPTLPIPTGTPPTQSPDEMPFTGPFAKFTRISALPERQKKMTVVGAWNNDGAPAYLHQFFYSMQLNAEVLDLLLLNRRIDNGNCLDFEKAKLNITWGGNIKVHCIDDEEWKKRHVDFMCSEEYGWNCNATEYEAVTKEYKGRKDEKNFTWRPFRGYVFRDLIANQDLPFWAWLDFDAFVGDFRRYPFNLLSQLSLVTGNSAVPSAVFMTGQLTAFNFEDPALGSAWKKFPEMQSPAHFTQYIAGKMPESSEERYWSLGYLSGKESLPGNELSYAIYPDIHGDDYYKGEWNRRNSSQVYVVSGRSVLLVSTSYSREEIEHLIELERSEPIDDLGSIGWTTGDDAVVDEDTIEPGERRFTQHITPHPLTISDPPVLRASLVRWKGQKPGKVWRRLERDTRHRGYERKLIRHHLGLKNEKWFEFPPYAITEDMVMRYNSDMVEVFWKGESRNETLFYRKDGERSIG